VARRPTFSADTLGRVHALLDANRLRQGIHDVYERLKTEQSLPDIYGLGVVRAGRSREPRQLPASLFRLLAANHPRAGGDRIQFYHRQVTLLLLPGALPGRETVRLLLDHEPQRPGEDEVETALRLLARVISRLSAGLRFGARRRALRQAPFFNFLLTRGKHALVVLKEETARPLSGCGWIIRPCAPQPGSYRSRQCSWWDFPDLLSWPQVQARCASFVPWRPTRFAGNSTSRTNHKRVTGSGRPRYRLPKFPSIASSIGAPAMGYRELWLQRVGQRMALRSCVQA